MNRRSVIAGSLFAAVSLAPFGTNVIADEQTLFGYSAESSRAERQWEEKFRAIPNPENLRSYMQHLSARPHNVGSPYDKDNAEWILAKFKEFGLDAHIEQFDVLYPTPKERVVELVEGGPKFVAKLQEPPVPQDPTSSQQNEQLPTYHAYSIDGDVTAPLVYVNYGVPEDYEQLERMGVSVKGKIVLFTARMPAFDPAKGSGYGETVVYRVNGPSRAGAAGAVAAFVRSVTARSIQSPHTGTLHYDARMPKIPAAALSTEDADFLERRCAERTEDRQRAQAGDLDDR